MIRSQFLILGLMLWGLSYLSFPMQVISLILIYFYHRYRFQHYHVLFLFICILFIIRIHLPHAYSSSKMIEIEEIHSHYAIAHNDAMRIIVYGLEDVHMDDIYEIRGQVRKIDAVNNFDCFSFQGWANRRGIEYMVYASDAVLVQHGSSLEHHLYAYVCELPQTVRDFLKMILYGIHEEDVNDLLVASGMHLSLLSGLLLKCMRRHRKTACLLRFLLLLGIGLLTQMCSSMWRLLCFSLCSLLFVQEDSKTVLGASMILTLFCFPYLYCEITFVLPVCLKLSSSFVIASYPNYLKSLFVLFPIQLLYYRSFSIIQWVLFRYLRMVYAFAYLCAWVILLFRMDWIIPCLQTGIEYLNQFSFQDFCIYGSIPLILLLWYIEALLKLYRTHHKRAMLSMFCCIFMIVMYPYFYPFARILTLDVGQGDCCVVIYPFREKVIMIDCMGSKQKNIPADIIVPRLHSLGIVSIDTVLITHDDYDHSGGLTELQELIEVKQVVADKQDAGSFQDDYLKLMLLDYQGKDANENSIVSYLQLYDTSILFMGDLGIQGEKQLLTRYPSLNADILKAGHHGSNTSSSSAFIHQIHPALTLISAGRDNRYHHPHGDVIKRLKQEQSEIHVTSWHGEGDLYITPWFTIFINPENMIYIL